VVVVMFLNILKLHCCRVMLLPCRPRTLMLTFFSWPIMFLWKLSLRIFPYFGLI